MYNIFDDHIYGHDLYAAARFLKWLGQMLKVVLTIAACVFPEPSVITFFLVTSVPFNAEEATSAGDLADPKGKQQKWALYFQKKVRGAEGRGGEGARARARREGAGVGGGGGREAAPQHHQPALPALSRDARLVLTIANLFPTNPHPKPSP